MTHPALSLTKNPTLMCAIINKYGTADHPWADQNSLPFFTRKYKIECASKAVRAALSDDLIKEKYRGQKPDNPLYGHCFHASVALYLLLGGKEEGFTIWRTDTDDHTWLTDNVSGAIVDPTVGQYTDFGRTPPYGDAPRRSGYQMSNAIKTILDRVASLAT